MARTPPPRKAARDDGTRTKKCGCRIDIETGAPLDLCEKHNEDEDGYDDEAPLWDPEEAGR